jgi:hypothetical protein
MDTEGKQHNHAETHSSSWDAATIARFERLRSGGDTPDENDPLTACLAAVGSPSCPLEAIEREHPLANDAAHEELQRQLRDDLRKLLDSIALLVIGVALAAIGAVFRDRVGVLLALAGILGGLVLLRVIVNAYRRRLIDRLCNEGRADDALARLERLNMQEAIVGAVGHLALLAGGGFVIVERWMGGNTVSAIGFGLFLGLPFLGRTIVAVRTAIDAVRRRRPIIGGVR